MFQFIVTNIFIISVGTILFLVIRSLPRIGEEETHQSARMTLLDRWVTSEIPERFDAALNSFMGKFLRRFKVFLLKVDNILTQRLKKITLENEKSTPHHNHFKEIAEEKEKKRKA